MAVLVPFVLWQSDGNLMAVRPLALAASSQQSYRVSQPKTIVIFNLILKVDKVINNAETMASDVDHDGVEWRTLALSGPLSVSLSLPLSPSLERT